MTGFQLKLPATSANLGPGFDALGLAMSLYLEIEAEVAPAFHIDATGRDAALCAKLDRNLILDTYRDVLAKAGRPAPPLRLTIQNGIPLGMGCGSSAAALVAGVLLANRFGELGLTDQQLLEEACQREGHPDNVAACWLGGLTASAMDSSGVTATSFGADLDWRLLVALPKASLATEKARGLLPESYSRADAVANIQATALLVSAFAMNRPELLAKGMADRVHQPYRMAACPLLPLLLPMTGVSGVYGVALSGAGPSVLIVADRVADVAHLVSAARELAQDQRLEVVDTKVARGAVELRSR